MDEQFESGTSCPSSRNNDITKTIEEVLGEGNNYYIDTYTQQIYKGNIVLPHEPDAAYIAHLSYIGTEKRYKEYVEKWGLTKFYTLHAGKTICVGFNKKTQEWYGWSHRGYGKFGIGFVVKEGSMLADKIAAGYVTKTLEHCEVLARIFADLMD